MRRKKIGGVRWRRRWREGRGRRGAPAVMCPLVCSARQGDPDLCRIWREGWLRGGEGERAAKA
jgi:hypothetical protein